MSLNISGLNDEENILFQFGKMYEKFGYVKLKMSKFEKYDFYINNKYFLNSSGMITFTDINGDLLALKPHTTLSIAKRWRVGPNKVSKIYYHDDVYRICRKTKLYEKITQYGVECIGDIDLYNLCEVVGLAADSLKSISNETVLNISHLGVIIALLSDFNIEEMQQFELFKFIEDKNVKGIQTICTIVEIPDDVVNQILSLVSAYGPVEIVMPKLKKKITNSDAVKCLDELEQVVKVVQSQVNTKIIIDMSMTMGYMNYYDGIMFKGFVRDISDNVIIGGQYNKLMKCFGRSINAIGFAIYLDFIGRRENKEKHDIDVFVLYSDNDDVNAVYDKVRSLTNRGSVVFAGKTIDKSLNEKQVINFGEL